MRFVAEVAERTVLVAEGQLLLDGPTREVLYAVDVLRKAAIKPPQIVQLSLILRDKGVPLNAITLDEAVKGISEVVKSKTH